MRFYVAVGLTNDLIEASAAHRLGRYASALVRHQLLILDEAGCVPRTKGGTALLYSFLSALPQQVRMIGTTTVPCAECPSLGGGKQGLRAALLDRDSELVGQRRIDVVAFRGFSDQPLGAITVDGHGWAAAACKGRFRRQEDGCARFCRGELADVGGKPAGRGIGVDEEMTAAAIVDNLGNLSVRGLEAKG